MNWASERMDVRRLWMLSVERLRDVRRLDMDGWEGNSTSLMFMVDMVVVGGE